MHEAIKVKVFMHMPVAYTVGGIQRSGSAYDIASTEDARLDGDVDIREKE